MESVDPGILALWYLLAEDSLLEEGGALYGVSLEEQETADLVAFVRRAQEELRRRKTPPVLPGQPVRITPALRIYIGEKELKLRPMAKTVLLLFLRHPEGIALKSIGDYREELGNLYRRVSRFQEPEVIERCIGRVVDIFENDFCVNISRVNAAVDALLEDPIPYRIGGAAGLPKAIPLDRRMVKWE
ncbi:MAG: hypothetical protein IK008_03830 [Bacteroidales bacterium]|nr:hypothetical protein [Bacteroidales bacterium]